MKKIITLLLCSIMIISFSSVIFAYSETNSETKILETFISNKDVSEIKVVNTLGDIVDGREIRNKLLKHEYIQVNNLLKENNLFLTYNEETIQRETYDISSTVNREFVIGHYGYDVDNRRMQEWITFMNVSYRENSNGTLRALGNPRITVDADFGSAWSTSYNNVSTGYRYKNSQKEIEFYGSYRLKAKLGIPLEIGGVTFPIGANFDYGTIHVNKTVK